MPFAETIANEKLPKKWIEDVHALVASYPCVPITVDCVIFGFDENELKVLLIRSDLTDLQRQMELTGRFCCR